MEKFLDMHEPGWFKWLKTTNAKGSSRIHLSNPSIPAVPFTTHLPGKYLNYRITNAFGYEYTNYECPTS